jgi:hypothetical protein
MGWGVDACARANKESKKQSKSPSCRAPRQPVSPTRSRRLFQVSLKSSLPTRRTLYTHPTSSRSRGTTQFILSLGTWSSPMPNVNSTSSPASRTPSGRVLRTGCTAFLRCEHPLDVPSARPSYSTSLSSSVNLQFPTSQHLRRFSLSCRCP